MRPAPFFPLFLSLCLWFVSLFSFAGENSPDMITLPKFKCPVEITFYVIYTPTTGPNRNFNVIGPPLSEWAKFGTLVGDRGRITEDRTVEDGVRMLTRATTIKTDGNFEFSLPKPFLEKIIRYNVEDPTTRTVFIYWEPGMEAPVRNVHQPQCR